MADLKAQVADYIKSGETSDNNLGLEIEHFVVNDEGIQIGFNEISSLIKLIGESLNAKIHYMDGYPVGYATDTYATSLEPSCQFEISINPYSDIDMIGKIYDEFTGIWNPIFKARGYKLITKGNLPLVETGKITPDDIPLSPKKRYIYMDNYFKTSGRYGKYMMRASASAQVSVDYKSENDMVRKLRVLQKISPVLMMMLENKTEADSTLNEHPDEPHLLRIQEWDDLDSQRTGFIPHSLDEDFGYDRMADVICSTPLILFTYNGETYDVGSDTAYDLLDKGIISISDDTKRTDRIIEHIMSMGFFHFRVKKYIEIRIGDSVPICKALGYVALIKGIVYSDSALTLLEKELSSVDSLLRLQDTVDCIKKNGYEAIIYNGKTVREWADHLIGIASGNLSDNERVYLNYVRAFCSYCKEEGNGQRTA